MKAGIYTRYGAPEVIQISDIEKPVPKDHEVLVRVHSASVNPYDWHFMRGLPYPLRLAAGLRKPKVTRLGTDVAGQVETVGSGVTQFKPGDAVFGMAVGAFAEYVCASESKLCRKPDSVSFEQAASVPIAACTALQGLRDKGHIQPGHNVLVNGAAGGVGTFAVQIAKSFGASVTGVCSARNLQMVRSLGADFVIDYTQRDFTKNGQRFDLILDCISNHSLSACRRALTPQGSYVAVGGPASSWMIGFAVRLIKMPVLSRLGSQKLGFIGAKSSQQDLTTIAQWIATGKVTPAIDRRYSLQQLPDAIRYSEAGHARGKIIITLA